MAKGYTIGLGFILLLLALGGWTIWEAPTGLNVVILLLGGISLVVGFAEPKKP